VRTTADRQASANLQDPIAFAQFHTMIGNTVTQHHRVRGGEAVRSTPPAGLETDCSTAGLAMLWKPHARSPGKHVARPEEDGPGSRKVETADWETKQTRVRGTRLLTTSRSPPPTGFTTTRASWGPRSQIRSRGPHPTISMTRAPYR
jgi:hypothetical protein